MQPTSPSSATSEAGVIDRIVRTIAEASSDGPIAVHPPDALSGQSGKKLVGLLQRLPGAVGDDAAAYLEVGVFRGLTLLSVAATNPATKCFGIDNFAYFDPRGENRRIVLDGAERLGARNARLIDSDYEDALEALTDHVGTTRIGVYFIDGPHDYRSQLMCLMLAVPFLHPSAVIVVDDANYAHVRQANRDFLRTHVEFKLLFEAYSDAHPGTHGAEHLRKAREGWWDGVNVLVRDPAAALEYAEPPTERDRTRFENDSVVHSARLAEVAPEALRLTDALLGLRPLDTVKYLRRAWRGKRRLGARLRDRSRVRNTYSAGIVGEHWNASVIPPKPHGRTR